MPFSSARRFIAHHASLETVAPARCLCNPPWQRIDSTPHDIPPTLEGRRRLSPQLKAITAAHGGSDLSGFGSVIHGTENPRSDLDLLVEFAIRPSFEQFVDLKLAREDRLQVRADLVTRSGLRTELLCKGLTIQQPSQQGAVPI